MKRPMVILAAAWLAGMLMANAQPELKEHQVLIFYFILIISSLLFLKKCPDSLNRFVKKEWYGQLVVLLLLLPCLFLTGFWRMEQKVREQSTAALPWKQLEAAGETHAFVQGTVKEKRCEEQTVLILTDCILWGYYDEEKVEAGNCRITVETEGEEWLPETFVGNEILVYGKFFTYQEAGNPGQFDAWEYYSGKECYASVKALKITVLDAGKNMPGHGMFLMKQQMRKSLTVLYPEEKAGVLAAMMLGDKDLLEDEIKELYQKNGISHILAISGLHISMLCMGLFRGLRKIGASLWISAGAAVLFLTFYICYTGTGISSLRAAVMCFVLFGAKLFRRSYDLLSSLSVAAIIVTALRPTELTSAGFLLSFGAVLGVAAAQEVQQKLGDEVRRTPLIFGTVVQWITIPISVWFYYELSPYSIVLNLLVIPLVSLILGGGMVSMLFGIVLPGAAKLPAGGTYLLLEFYEWLGEMTQELPFSYVLVGRPTAWQLVAYYAVFFAAWKGFVYLAGQDSEKKRNASGWCIIAGFVLSAGVLFFPNKNETELLFLDVSQGDCALIFTENGAAILSDCGSSDVTKVGEYRLSPVLKQNGIALIDVAVVSHLDSDHTSGVKELLENMQVYEGRSSYVAGYKGAIGIVELVLPKVAEKSEAYLLLETLAAEKNVAVRYVEAGAMLYREENLMIECLSPENAVESENDTSLVFLLQTPRIACWLMGDAETGSEKALLKRLHAVNAEALLEGKTILLKVGHHGSQTSSGQAFIDFVQPDISVISCGYQNSYGHPHDSVLERLQKIGSKIYRTDLQGAIIVKLGKQGGVTVRGWKEN